jgi:hypothetical protein
VLAHQEKKCYSAFGRSPTLRVVVRVGVATVAIFERNLRQDVATVSIQKGVE